MAVFHHGKKGWKPCWKRRKERDRFLREIRLHADGLAAEMNMRLFLEQEAGSADVQGESCASGRILFVEEIEVTDIRYPKKVRRNKIDGNCERSNWSDAFVKSAQKRNESRFGIVSYFVRIAQRLFVK